MPSQNNYQLADWFKRDIDEIKSLTDGIQPAGDGHLGKYLLSFRRIFVVGQGRTGLILRMFAMRLMQLGIDTFVVGDSTTPAIQPDDLLIAASGSGETAGVIHTARLAKDLGSHLAVITSRSESTLAKLADHLTIVPGETTKISASISSALPLASTLEQATLIFLDCLVAWMARKSQKTNETMMAKHANLE